MYNHAIVHLNYIKQTDNYIIILWTVNYQSIEPESRLVFKQNLYVNIHINIDSFFPTEGKIDFL